MTNPSEWDTFAVQNWVITPVPGAAGQQPSPNSYDRQWRLTLTGIYLFSLQASGTYGWSDSGPEFGVTPDIGAAANWAVSTYQLPIPATPYRTSIQVEQSAAFAALSWPQTEDGLYYPGPPAGASGVGVPSWELQFVGGQDAITQQPLTNLYNGFNWQFAFQGSVEDWALSYKLDIVGYIRFVS